MTIYRYLHLLPQILQAVLPGGEGRVLVNLADDVTGSVVELKGKLGDVVVDGCGERLGLCLYHEAHAGEAKVIHVDFHHAFVVATKELIERRAGLLDPRHLHRHVFEVGEIVAPVGKEQHFSFLHGKHVDDGITTLVRLDDEFYLILADGNGEVRAGCVKRCSRLGRKEFSHSQWAMRR